MSLAAGARLGPYEILGLLGTGGMGEVYRARDTRLNRDVALKRVHPQHTDRFEQEARAIAALNHPHICQIYDVGPDYLVMEYVEGTPLAGPLTPAEAVRLGMEIASGLEEAHAHGILHRDLKPANILVTAKGVAKLLDFGLARMIADGEATRSMTVSGTPLYMSPEQVEGQPLDARSDVFSFGAVLYELVSGRRAFESVAAVLRDAPAPLDGPVAAVALRCLAKQTTARFQTIAEVKTALEQVVAPPRAQQPSIAVLPFANLSLDKEQEFFSDGLAEEIINLLAQMPGLKVTARTSAFAFRGKEQDIRKIADALDVHDP
jgi:serine/threonine protein kinase